MPKPATNKRQQLIRLIHVAKRDLQMDEYSYLTVLAREGKESSADMTIKELERTLEHMKKCGFKVRTKAKSSSPAKAAPSRPLAGDAESKKIRALWLFLHELGAVKNPSEQALASYVKRITTVDDLHWINGKQAATLIEVMKKWAMRFLPEKTKAMAQQVASAISSGELHISDEVSMHLRSVVGIAQARMTFDPMLAAYESLKPWVKA